MEAKSPSNTNWLSLLRRKIHKKFKRNRQKLENEIVSEPGISAQSRAQSTSYNENVTSSTRLNSSLQAQLSFQDCEEMKKISFFWPNLSRIEAQKILSSKANGSFLVRDSSEEQSFTLSFRTNSKTFHCRNQWSQVLASKNDTGLSLVSVIDTIRKSQSSVVGFVKCDDNGDSFPISSYAVRLIYPICRKISVPTLQDICLSKIKSKVNQNNIQSLPLPPKIKDYVSENYNTL